MQRYKNLVVLLVALLIVIAGGSVLYKKINNDGNTREKVEINKIDIEKVEGAEKIPAGFPKDIPLELGEVIDSYTMDYEDRGVMISAVSFRTFRTPADLFGFYRGSLNIAGYLENELNTNQDRGILYMEKGGNQLAISIGISNVEDGKREVQIVHTENTSR